MLTQILVVLLNHKIHKKYNNFTVLIQATCNWISSSVKWSLNKEQTMNRKCQEIQTIQKTLSGNPKQFNKLSFIDKILKCNKAHNYMLSQRESPEPKALRFKKKKGKS